MTKTLDEVIRTLEGCFLENRKEWCIENCPYLQNDEQGCRKDVLTDALHYLKEYQNKEMFYNKSVDHMVQMINEHEDRVSFYLAEMNKNNPLTWNELKGMQGKPVWIEYNLHLSEEARKLSKAWFVIFHFRPLGNNEMVIMTNKFVFTDYELGNEWQAYRKERK